MIIVDASVVAFLLIEGEMTESARELYRMDPEWVTPPILNHEMLSILGHLGAEEQSSHSVEEIWRDVRALLGPRQQVPDPVGSLRLAIKLGISGYEAQYLFLAEHLDLPMLTLEQRLLEAAPERAITPEGYLVTHRGG